jgi:uncharacterized membrane protein YheB (UPF0754 family)
MIRGKIRTIDELIVRYKRHTQFKDLFVEGGKDQIFFKLIFKYLNLRINVYPINTIEVKQNIADNLGLDLKLKHNNRNKVITLAHSLESYKKERIFHQCRCVIDKDFDQFLKKMFSCPILLYTDYNCIEMYTYNELCIKKFILSLPKFPISAKALIEELNKVLQTFFLFRLTDESLKLGLDWKNFIDNCVCKNCTIQFNFSKFSKKFINCNRLNKPIQQKFIQEFERNRNKLTNDVRNQIHKDDLRQLFVKFIRKCGGITDYNKNSELYPLFASLEINDIKKEKLFKDLIDWYTTEFYPDN